jgi:phosphorylase kinase alpha/beta subunit
MEGALGHYYQEVSRIIVDKQNPVTGLLPASTAISSHGDYRDAWVRDNVYSILAVWALGLAYRSVEDSEGRGRELERRTVQLMRGLLRSMMTQAHKVEAFKKSRHPRDALHAKYDTTTGGTVVADEAWGHLQVDATSVYLVMLAQMIASGLDIIWTDDEVHFVQNLVYYIERAYRTADFGIWERGAKSNSGRVELNASSLGMAKAALEALAGFDLFGGRGARGAVIHVSPDNIAQAAITLHGMLPRESHSKEVDAALLGVIGYPAYAVSDPIVRERTRVEIVTKLEGRYGLKRFLRDGHQTEVEDESRLYYEQAELRQFEHIECEWPLFFTYLYLDALLSDQRAIAERYRLKLEAVLVEQSGQRLLPELYYVPKDAIEKERKDPGSQVRLPNDNVPLVWAQSLYLLGRMVEDGLVRASDIDPLGRRRQKAPPSPVVQILLLAEDDALADELAAHGVRSETPEDIAPVQTWLPDDISRAHGEVGRSARLGLTGRSNRALKSLTTSRIYQIDGRLVVCLAPFFLQQEFYLCLDMRLLVRRLKAELAYIRRHWMLSGRPTVALLLTRSLLSADQDVFYALMNEVEEGSVGGVPVRQGALHELLPTASYERLTGLVGFEFPVGPVVKDTAKPHALRLPDRALPLSPGALRDIVAVTDTGALVAMLNASGNLYEQIELLARLAAKLGLSAEISLKGEPVTIEALVTEVYEDAGRARSWSVVRHAAGVLGKSDVDLNLAVAALLVAQKNIQVGRAYSPESLIVEPLPDQELQDRIARFCRDDLRDRILTQEVLLHLGVLVREQPELLANLTTIRVSQLIGLLAGDLARETAQSFEDAYQSMMERAPFEIQERLERVLARFGEIQTLAQDLEQLRVSGEAGRISWNDDLGLSSIPEPPEGWLAYRQFHGVVDRRTADFYTRTWRLFRHAPCIVIGDKLDLKNRLESRLILGDMTPGEAGFALLVEHVLNHISAPEYRQLTVEALLALSKFFEHHPTVVIKDTLIVDAVIGHAVRLLYLKRHPERAPAYDEDKVLAWSQFSASSTKDTSTALIFALTSLMTSS